MNYEMDWGYSNSDRDQLKKEIVSSFANGQKQYSFLDSFNNPKVQFASTVNTITLPMVDFIANKSKLTLAIGELMEKTFLQGHHIWQGFSVASLTLLISAVTFAKLHQLKKETKLNTSVDQFLKSEYHI